ncbi:anthrone oxygenase family protein [Streptomyces sp. NPDC126514]|uniref:anthrone oxygenase family protein n=1 Tax=Streptomyces sp. NPDC126514 TaxID=3155210 RepID=UPI00331A3845
MTTRTATLTAATLTTGLLAGTFYAFGCAVLPGLARSEDAVYVEVMRNINEVIQNPAFLLTFLGAPALTGWAAWHLRGAPGRRWVWTALAANALALVVTVTANIPLNEALARTGDPAVLREEFEAPWVAWNAARAALLTAATICLTIATGRRSRL